ncbi:MAG: penicillin-binding protein activator LpoB, partial [Kiritimatiellia bacterium]
LTLADQMANDILSHPFPPEGEDKPILVTLGIQNRTQTHLDMKALADTIETRLLNTGKIRLVNASRRDDLLKEQGYQLANVTPETRVQIGKQLGARYMMTGSLVEIEKESGREVRVSKKQDVYYQLTVEITDLETGLIVLRKQRDRLRRASKPIIGW